MHFALLLALLKRFHKIAKLATQVLNELNVRYGRDQQA